MGIELSRLSVESRTYRKPNKQRGMPNSKEEKQYGTRKIIKWKQKQEQETQTIGPMVQESSIEETT